jgi:hypothetical protein
MLLSAAYQISHPLATKYSPTGTFSSRFVTCCLTGTMEGGIDVLAWQAAEQGEALVKAGMVEATVEPGMVRVRKPSEGEFIPEVFYRSAASYPHSYQANEQFQERVRSSSQDARQAHFPSRISLCQCKSSSYLLSIRVG